MDPAYSSETEAGVRTVDANFSILCLNDLDTLAVLELSSLGVPLLDQLVEVRSSVHTLAVLRKSVYLCSLVVLVFVFVVFIIKRTIKSICRCSVRVSSL